MGEPFVPRDDRMEQHRRNLAKGPALLLSPQQQQFIESILRGICERGGWTFRIGACGPERDHVHVLLDLDRAVHGKEARKWLKRWVGEALDGEFGRPQVGTWWAEGGSTIAVKDRRYLNNCFAYIFKQRATPVETASRLL